MTTGTDTVNQENTGEQRITLLLVIRSLVFYIGYIGATSWFGVSALFIGWLPYTARAAYLLNWNRFVVFWLATCCGVRLQIDDQRAEPQGPVVIVANHQSQWETYFLQYYFRPVTTILKRELLAMPVFGWGLRQMQPIAIDRNSPRESLRQMLNQGKERLHEGLSVLVFPEGTRQPAGERHRFARGGAGLACNAAVAVVPVAHNAGRFWPSGGFIKYPGVLKVVIGEEIATGDQSAQDINLQAEDWVHTQLDLING